MFLRAAPPPIALQSPDSGGARTTGRARLALRPSRGSPPPDRKTSLDACLTQKTGWMTYHRDPDTQRARYSMWRAAVDRLASPAFRAFGVSMRLDLAAHPDAPATALTLGYATGRRALVDILQDMRAAGTHHVTLNPGADRPVREVIEELAAHVLPVFHDGQA